MMEPWTQRWYNWYMNKNTTFPIIVGVWIWLALSGFEESAMKNYGPFIGLPWMVIAILLRAGVLIQNNWFRIKRAFP